MTTETIKIPNFDKWEELDFVMSNCDREIDKEIEAELKSINKSYSRYAGWNFCGYVWYEKSTNLFHCQVWVLLSPKKIVSAETLEEIMIIVSEEFGHD